MEFTPLPPTPAFQLTSPTPEPGWATRLRAETEELRGRFHSLGIFLSSQQHAELARTNPNQTRLLNDQHIVMGRYLSILEARLRDYHRTRAEGQTK